MKYHYVKCAVPVCRREAHHIVWTFSSKPLALCEFDYRIALARLLPVALAVFAAPLSVGPN